MTWHKAFVVSYRVMGLAVVAAALAAGCGDDPKKVTLRLTSPEPDQVLTTAEDDVDPSRRGLQFTVTGESSGVRGGTTVNLFIGGEMVAQSEVDDDGTFEHAEVTLPPGTQTIFVRTATGSVSSDEEQQYTHKALEITSPENGATVNATGDETTVDVTVQAFAIDTSQDIGLMVNGEELEGDESPDEDGQAVFSDVVLPETDNEIVAFVEDDGIRITSEPVSIEVVQQCPTVTFISPVRSDEVDGAVTLGGDDSCPEGDSGNPFETTVEISTDAGNGRAAELFVNGQPVQATTVRGTTARFEGVALTNRTTENTLAVEVENADGVRCMADVELEINVDCDGPDCRIESPTPVDYVDDDNELTLYLNESMQNGAGFDVLVETNAETAGQTISLIVDDRTGSAAEETAEADPDDDEIATATFVSVELDDGPHTIQARCEDAAGNVTFTERLDWVADTAACNVDVTAPAADTFFVPGDDDDNDNDNGTQVVATSSIFGIDCVGQRAAPCDPDAGITGVTFAPYDGTTPLLSTITLDDERTDQELCVEIEDRAGNVGRGSIGISYRAQGPALLIERPSDGDRYNALGNDGYIADANRLSINTCDADFWVACSELGEIVSLRHNGVGGDVFASGICAEPESGDPDLPDGYAGRVKLTAPFQDGDTSAVVVATQRVLGTSDEPLIGVSSAIDLEGDCQIPDPSFSIAAHPCSPATSGQVALANAVADVAVVESSGDPTLSVSLSLDHDVDGHSVADAPTRGGNIFEFDNVDRGGEGTVTVTADARDAFENSASIQCMATILADLPEVTGLTLPDGVAYAPGGVRCDPNATADPGDTCAAGDYCVRVQATIDTDVERQVNILINGATVASDVELLAGNTIDRCVPLPDDLVDGLEDSSTLTVEALSGVGPGRAESSVDVSLQTTQFDALTEGQSLTADDDCGGTGFAVQVTALVDIVHQGADYTISSSNGAMVTGTVDTGGADSVQISACLDLAGTAADEGPNTISLEIGGTSFQRTLGVVVNNTPPPTAITIDAVELPADDNNYRAGPVLAKWAVPTSSDEAWAGQLESYAMYCGHAPLAPGSTQQEQDAFLAAATEIALPPELTPDAAEDPDNPGMHVAPVTRPAGQASHCVVRGLDAAGQGTPLDGTTDLTLPFRQEVIVDPAPATTTRAGQSVAGIGDVDGDQIDDVLVGGATTARLVFGATSADAITLNGDKTFTGGFAVGFAVASLGDFNGDGFNDFALTDFSRNSNAGRVHIFFGRPRVEWDSLPSSFNLDGACNADLCLQYDDADGYLGYYAAPVGDFDGDGFVDVAVGAPGASSLAGELIIVLGGQYERRDCGECLATEQCVNDACEPMIAGPYGLEYGVPSGEWLNRPGGAPAGPRLRGFRLTGDSDVVQFGQVMASVGNLDGFDGSDVVVGSFGSATVTPKVFFLSGRPYTVGGGTGFQALAMSDLGFPDAQGDTDGQPFSTTRFTQMAAAGNVYDVASPVASGTADVLMSSGSTGEFFLFLGETALDDGQRIRFAGSGNPGQGLATAFNPNLSDPALPSPNLRGDLDGDGRGEICTVNRLNTGPAHLWYADELPEVVDANEAPVSTSSVVWESGAAGQRKVDFVGDMSGDGFPDIVIGDWELDSARGMVILLH